jgi:LacI family transcriptional regulator
MPVTMREVAERAGVSKATVSYVLNGREVSMRIPEETRQRVLAVVRDLGYHPNALARGLAQKQTHTVAVVMQYPALFSGASGFTNELMHGVTDAAVRLGYDLMLQTRCTAPDWSADATGDVEAEVATLTDGRVDGALLLRDLEDPLLAVLRQRGFPTVLMFTHADDPDQWYVDCDNVAGGRLAVEHLMALGHRRIAHLAGVQRSAAAKERRIGYLQALQANGLEPDPDLIVETVSPQADYTAVERLFARPPAERPTALFAWSDDVAIQAMSVLRQTGLRVPEDVAVVGFDSTALCDHTDPPLTSVRQPVYTMAAQALEMLTRNIGGETPEQTQIRVAPRLIVRRSCGAGAQ